jgi:hypothetical protein
VVGVAVVAALAVGAIAVVALRSGGGGDGEDEPQIREALLDDVHPDPDCPDAPEAPAAKDGQVVVHVVRVVDGCLAFGSEVVGEDQVDDRLEQRRDEPDVVAADVAVARQPTTSVTSGTGAAAEEPVEQWALAPEHLDGEKVRSLWPADAPEMRVAAIDTGIDRAHLDLADQVVDHAPWVHDYDGDYRGHGTSIAGITAAADDDAGVVGLTPAARLMDVQYYDDGGDHLAGPSDDLGEYVRWAVDHGADVVNMSLGGPDPSDTDLTAVLYAERQGVVVVAAAGNCGSEHAGQDDFWRPPWARDSNPCDETDQTNYPAGYDTVLSVANHTEDEERAETSSANATVDIAAPGTKIASDCPTDGDDLRPTCESSGTSEAAPYVAATAALLRARHPDATPAAIREAITHSARPADGQEQGRRNDAFGSGLLDPAAAAAYLDEHPGGTQPDQAAPGGRTAAAYVDAGAHRLMMLDDGVTHPVRAVAEDDYIRSVDWSGDHTQLVGAANAAVFSWTGPGSSLVEQPCTMCDIAYLDRLGGDLVVAVDNANAVTRFDPGTFEPLGSVKLALPAPDEPSVLRGDTGRALLVGHSPDPGSSGPDTLWLVDPVSGEPLASHAEDGNLRVSDVAVDATGDRVAYVGGQSLQTCDGADRIYVLDAGDGGLDEVANAAPPASDLGILETEDVFFNGDALYATFMANAPDDGGSSCSDVGSAGLWRLDDDGQGWTQIDAGPLAAVRPVEGLTGDPDTGKVTIADDSGDREGRFVPTGADGGDQVDLGTTNTSLWATPTADEVDLARGGSTPPLDPSTTETTEAGGSSGGTVPNTTEAALARYEDYIHALGEGDVDTLCEIAPRVAQDAQEQGFPSCEAAFGAVLGMISPPQAAALRTATVDPDKVQALGGKVEVPVDAVVADVAFTEEDLGSYTLAYQDGNWFVIG